MFEAQSPPTIRVNPTIDLLQYLPSDDFYLIVCKRLQFVKDKIEIILEWCITPTIPVIINQKGDKLFCANLEQFRGPVFLMFGILNLFSP